MPPRPVPIQIPHPAYLLSSSSAVVPMGSADRQFHLAELLTQNYSPQEGRAEAPQDPDKPEEGLDKDFIDQVWGLSRLSSCPPRVHAVQPHAHGLYRGPAAEPAPLLRALAMLRPLSVLLISSVVLMQVYCPVGTC